uniref:Protein root UVB sensitive 2, chloroplastic n=1 Tax=Aegilops tauschii TaxID=37682 RepID=M8CBP9_AEGTA
METPRRPESWVEISESVSRLCSFDAGGGGGVSVKLIQDNRMAHDKLVDSFLNKFFPSGYPYSVNEGYLTYTKFRALQHFSSAMLHVLSTQVYDLPLRKQRLTQESSSVAAWGQEWIQSQRVGGYLGMAVVAARATRLPIYSSFAKEGNLSDLFAKGEAISTLFNVMGIGAGIGLSSTVCSTTQGKLIIGPLLSAVHIWGVVQEMRATPINTLNPQRTAMVVADFIKSGKVSSPAELRYREDLLFPNRLIEEAGSVKVGQPFRRVLSPRLVEELRSTFPNEKFLLTQKSDKAYMVLEQSATGEDALRGWLVAAFASEMERSGAGPRDTVLNDAYQKMESVFPMFVSEVKSRGWYTGQFLDGNHSRIAYAKSE